MRIRRVVAQAFLLVAILAYVRPFVALVRDGVVLFTLSGAQLVTSETFYTTGIPDPAHVPPDPCLLGALFLGAVAFFAGFGSRRAWLRIAAAAAVAGACASVAVFPITTAGRIPAVLQHGFCLRVAAGYWVTLVCYVVAAGMVIYRQAAMIHDTGRTELRTNI